MEKKKKKIVAFEMALKPLSTVVTTIRQRVNL